MAADYLIASLPALSLDGPAPLTLERFLASPRVGVLYADEATTRSYAGLFAQLRRQGTPIPTNDLWIAALAVQHGLALHSRDAHFDSIPQLLRV